MMRILGGWIALTPELPVKLLFGRHVWDCAQHADLWGRRLPELRAPAQQSEPANDAFAAFMDLIDSRERPGQSAERIVSVHRVLKRHLVTVYQRHLAMSNPVYEPPTRRILQRCIDEERRHAAAGAAVLAWQLRGSRELAQAEQTRPA
jgi:1,2-phenylacetyl-CoA epoxidase catalytic subunit